MKKKNNELKNKLKAICSPVDQATTLASFYNIIIKFVLELKSFLENNRSVSKESCKSINQLFNIYNEVGGDANQETENRVDEINVLGLSAKFEKRDQQRYKVLSEKKRKYHITLIKRAYTEAIYLINSNKA